MALTCFRLRVPPARWAPEGVRRPQTPPGCCLLSSLRPSELLSERRGGPGEECPSRYGGKVKLERSPLGRRARAPPRSLCRGDDRGWGGPQEAEPELPATTQGFTERGSQEPRGQQKATRLTAREGMLQLGPKLNQRLVKKPSTFSRPGAGSRLCPLEEETQAPGKASPSSGSELGRSLTSEALVSRESPASREPGLAMT